MGYSFVDINGNNVELDLTQEVGIKTSIKNILLTSKGTLPGRPEFGSDVSKYLFEPMNAFTKLSLQESIKTSIYRNEPRIANLNVVVQEDKTNYSLICVIEFTTTKDLEPQIVTINLKS